MGRGRGVFIRSLFIKRVLLKTNEMDLPLLKHNPLIDEPLDINQPRSPCGMN